MAGERAVVGEDHCIAHRAIVADMAVGQKISAIADPRLSLGCRAAVDRDELAKGIFVADFEIGRLALIFQILRLLADRAVGVEFVVAPGAHRPASSVT